MGSPPGGTYTGSGTNGNIFNPASSGSGTFTVIYQFTDSNTCSDTSAISIVVSECLTTRSYDLLSEGLVLQPNPTSGKVTITSTYNPFYEVKVRDINNRLIVDRKTEENYRTEINLENYKAGIYFIEIQLEKKTLYSKIIRVE
jgi:ribosomal protein L23